MKFSVLMSLYYKENPAYLRESLESVFCQTLKPDEVVLVEDGPLTPALYDVVEEYARQHTEMKRVPLAQNGGLGKALREGLKHCSHSLVARMDTDDVCKPERFEKQVAFMENHPEIDVVGAWIDEFKDTTAQVVSTRKLPEYPNEIREFGKKRNPMNHPTVMFRKEAVERAGGFQHFHLFEDYHLWVRMMQAGARLYNIPEALLYFRISPDVYKRRGGWQYALVELRFQWCMHKTGYIGLSILLQNILIRLSTRIVPNAMRGYIYKKFLRK